MGERSGDWSAEIIANLEVSESQPQLVPTFSDGTTEEYNLVSSRDLGDPTLDEVLQWHMRLCALCALAVKTPPAMFGIKRTAFCPEYWEIINDYREYEGEYAWKGNP